MPLELAAVALASLPFIVEQRFGILGTGLNPDMSQHLFAADRLAAGGSERLIEAGYPLGPHSIAVAVSAIGPSTVQAFDGLAIAIAVATCLVGLGPLERLAPSRRIAGALLVGFAYLLASTYVQGAFKEALEALFLLAFAVGLGELAAEWPLARRGGRAACARSRSPCSRSARSTPTASRGWSGSPERSGSGRVIELALAVARRRARARPGRDPGRGADRARRRSRCSPSSRRPRSGG